MMYLSRGVRSSEYRQKSIPVKDARASHQVIAGPSETHGHPRGQTPKVSVAFLGIH
jgi:hypothetical protein